DQPTSAMRLLISPCTQLLTLAGSPLPRRGPSQSDLGMIQQGAILIEEDLISKVGPVQAVEGTLDNLPVERISAEGCVVMPGFVDSHAHPVFVKPRDEEYELRIRGSSYRQIAANGGGLFGSVKAVRNCSKEQLAGLTLPRLTNFWSTVRPRSRLRVVTDSI